MPRISVVLFDLGSTLLHFDADWENTLMQGIHAMQARLEALGYPLDPDFANHYRATSREYFRWRDDNLTEVPAPQVFRQIMADYCCEELPEAHVHAALSALYAATQAHWKTEDDALSTLRRLHESGYSIGLISNAGYDEDVQVLIDQGGLRPYLEFILTSAAAGVRKPHPDIFRPALKFFQVHPEQAVMVGDFLQADILGAQKLGMHSIWITRRADLASALEYRAHIIPERTVDTLAEIPDLLAAWD